MRGQTDTQVAHVQNSCPAPCPGPSPCIGSAWDSANRWNLPRNRQPPPRSMRCLSRPERCPHYLQEQPIWVSANRFLFSATNLRFQISSTSSTVLFQFFCQRPLWKEFDGRGLMNRQIECWAVENFKRVRPTR